MPKSKEDEAYESWIADVKGRLPEEKRTHLEAIAEDPGTRELFKGGLREGDYYRRLNEYHERNSELQNAREAFMKQAAEQNSWYEKASKEYEEAMRLINKRGDGQPSDPDATGFNGRAAVDSADLDDLRKKYELVDRFDRALPQLVGQAASIAVRAVKDGFDIDPMEVINYAGTQGIPPLQAYEYLTRQEREDRAATQREQDLAAAKEEGAREERSKFQSPDRIRHPSASFDQGPSARLLAKPEGPDLSDRGTRAALAREEWFKMQEGRS